MKNANKIETKTIKLHYIWEFKIWVAPRGLMAKVLTCKSKQVWTLVLQLSLLSGYTLGKGMNPLIFIAIGYKDWFGIN